MGIYRRKDSAVWWCSFILDRRRIRRSTGTDHKQTAKGRAAEIESEARKAAEAGAKHQLTLSQAFGRYWLEHAHSLPSARDIEARAKRLLAGLGDKVRLSSLKRGMISSYAVKRRLEVSERSVNIEIEQLRAVMNRAHKVWGIETAEIDWKALLYRETDERDRILDRDEEARLFVELRPDYHPIVRFALMAGVRVQNAISLTWAQVDFEARVIRLRVKSKMKGGAVHYVPISAGLAALLSVERGRHQTFVFTYICRRNRHDPRRQIMQEKGRSYPFTHDGWRKEWGRALAAAEIEDFRFHDLRHTAGTRAYRASKNLKTVQRMLGHQDIRSTLRYIRSDVDDVRAAMEQVAISHDSVTALAEKKEKSGTEQ